MKRADKQDAIKNLAKIMPAPEGTFIVEENLERRLDKIKAGANERNLHLDYAKGKAHWVAIAKTAKKLRSLLADAPDSPLEGMLGNSAEAQARRFEKCSLEEIEQTIRFRLDVFEEIGKKRRGKSEGQKTSPLQEYYYRSLLKLWAECNGKMSKSKEGPLYRFLVAGCEALGIDPPGSESIPGIVARAKPAHVVDAPIRFSVADTTDEISCSHWGVFPSFAE